MDSADVVSLSLFLCILTALIFYYLGHAHGRLDEIKHVDDVEQDEGVKQPYIPGQQ